MVYLAVALGLGLSHQSKEPPLCIKVSGYGPIEIIVLGN